MREAILDAVVFDLEGVLVDWDPRHLYRQLIPDEDKREAPKRRTSHRACSHR